MSGSFLRHVDEQSSHIPAVLDAELPEADSDLDRKFLAEAACIPMLMIIHRLAYNTSGFLLDQQSADFGPLLMTPVDLLIPYIPAFIVPYAGTWFLGLAIIVYAIVFRTGNYRVFRAIYAAVLLTTVLEFVVWLCIPASISLRVEMQTLYAGGFLGNWLATIYASATPWNVFPSAHVGFAFMAWLYAQHFSLPSHKIWFQLCCISICLSVLFVRNHYLLDIPAGMAVTYAGYRLAFLPSINNGYFDRLSSRQVVLLVAFVCGSVAIATRIVMGDAWSL